MPFNFDAIVIGTGFGGAVAATRLAQKGKKVLMLERGTWWVTPSKIGKPPPSTRPSIPAWAKEQSPKHPVQYWTRPNHRQGLLNFFSAVRNKGNKDGLYQYSMFKQADILTASGVGGGSLIYSNVTVRPAAASHTSRAWLVRSPYASRGVEAWQAKSSKVGR